MKKLLFFAVSAILAGASYCTSVGEKIVAKVTNSENRRWCWNSPLPSLIYSQATVPTAHIALTVRIVRIVLIIRADEL